MVADRRKMRKNCVMVKFWRHVLASKIQMIITAPTIDLLGSIFIILIFFQTSG